MRPLLVTFKRNAFTKVSSSRLQPDGSLLFRASLSSTVEFKAWVLSFGKHAEVIEPSELREELAEEIAAMGRNYAETMPVSRVSSDD